MHAVNNNKFEMYGEKKTPHQPTTKRRKKKWLNGSLLLTVIKRIKSCDLSSGSDYTFAGLFETNNNQTKSIRNLTR